MKERYVNISLYRIIAVLLVVLFHIFFINSLEKTSSYIYLSKFVQGLSALSGFLLSQKIVKKVGKFYLSKLMRVAFPALLVLLFILLSNILYMLIMNNYDFASTFIGYRAYNGGLLIQPGNFYYILYIMGCYLITPLLQKKNWISIVIVILIVASETVVAIKIDPLYIITSFIIGYYIGVFSFKHYINKDYTLSDIPRSIIIGLIFVVSLFFSIYLSNNHISLKMPHIYLNIAYSLFGISSLFLFLILTKWINYKREFKFFKFTDSISYYIFLFNQTFLVGATNLTVFTQNFGINILIIFASSIAASILLYYFEKLTFGKIKEKILKRINDE